MAFDYLPRSDGEFDAWQVNFLAYAATHRVELGLGLLDVAPAVDAGEQWHADYLEHVAAQQAARSATQSKNASRRALVALVRPLVAKIQASAAVEDAERAALGITVPDRTRTPIGSPTSRPLVKVDFSKRLSHRIAFADEKTPLHRARPRGMMGVEVWVKVTALGEAQPAGPADLSFLMLATRSPAVAEYGGADAGKTAHYMVRWLSRRAEPGPWSETASATIGA